MAVFVQPPVVDCDGSLSISPVPYVPGVAHVAILMCTYNGGAFLADQLESFERQSHRNWSLYVSDDGSEDETLPILAKFASVWGGRRLEVLQGPQNGYVSNFLSLTCRVDIDADFFAWSDQDDIWGEDKLNAALTWLQSIPVDVPALYCGRTQLICESGNPRGFSPKFSLPPDFSNALVQNIGGGNTMVFNKAARALLMEAGADLQVPSHDWWGYQLVSGAGGIVHYDPQPTVLYRQHEKNILGSNCDWRARLQRLLMVFQGRFYEWNAQNIRALESMSHRLSHKHRHTLALFKTARKQKFPMSMVSIFRAGLYRQTLLGNLGLLLATLLKKI